MGGFRRPYNNVWNVYSVNFGSVEAQWTSIFENTWVPNTTWLVPLYTINILLWSQTVSRLFIPANTTCFYNCHGTHISSPDLFYNYIIASKRVQTGHKNKPWVAQLFISVSELFSLTSNPIHAGNKDSCKLRELIPIPINNQATARLRGGCGAL